jgi:excisionase family DNA binding protein
MEQSKQNLTLNISEDTISSLISFIENKILTSIKESPELIKSLFPEIKSDNQDELILYTTDEVAKSLRCSEVTVRTLCKSGKLSSSKPAGKSILISKKQLETYLKSLNTLS